VKTITRKQWEQLIHLANAVHDMKTAEDTLYHIAEEIVGGDPKTFMFDFIFNGQDLVYTLKMLNVEVEE
jgi:hypothetical protein